MVGSPAPDHSAPRQHSLAGIMVMQMKAVAFTYPPLSFDVASLFSDGNREVRAKQVKSYLSIDYFSLSANGGPRRSAIVAAAMHNGAVHYALIVMLRERKIRCAFSVSARSMPANSEAAGVRTLRAGWMRMKSE